MVGQEHRDAVPPEARVLSALSPQQRGALRSWEEKVSWDRPQASGLPWANSLNKDFPVGADLIKQSLCAVVLLTLARSWLGFSISYSSFNSPHLASLSFLSFFPRTFSQDQYTG